MSKSKKGKWKLNESEITWESSLYWKDGDPFDIEIKPDEKHTQSPNGKGYREKINQSRNFKKTNECITMMHQPTGIKSHGRFYGCHTKSEEQKLHKELLNALFCNLENKVAKHLKIAGR